MQVCFEKVSMKRYMQHPPAEGYVPSKENARARKYMTISQASRSRWFGSSLSKGSRTVPPYESSKLRTSPGLAGLTCLRVREEEEEPNSYAKYVLIPWDSDALRVEATPEAVVVEFGFRDD